MSRCEFSDVSGRCPNEATRRTDSRAFGRPDDALSLCEQHHQFVKAYWLEQAGQLPPDTVAADEPCEGC